MLSLDNFTESDFSWFALFISDILPKLDLDIQTSGTNCM